MRRRDFIALLGGTVLGGVAAAWPHRARAQSGRIARIGYLAPGFAGLGFASRDTAFRQGLHELGYAEGKNIIIEYRYAGGEFARLVPLAAELVALKVDVIVGVVTQASLAAKAATSVIPIVMAAVSDPVGSGLVASLARPGANVTGTSSQTSEVVGKSLELLREVVPKVTRVAVLWNPGNEVFQAQMLREVEVAGSALGIALETFGARDRDELERALTMIGGRADALLVLADPILVLNRERIVTFAQENRLPAMYGIKDYATAGGLMTYAANMDEQFRRTASYVDKILKGAKPGDLPVEQPTKFELVLNLKTARALGLTFPLTLLGRADEVIE